MVAPRQVEVDANGLRFETLLAGPDDGEAVVLLHGYPQSAESWRETMDWLAICGYRSIAPNLRGYSPGANPPEASAYAMDRLVADVLGIADSVGAARFHVVAHDWGAAVAWSLAGTHPQRLLSLTAISTPHSAALLEALRSPSQSARSVYMRFFQLPRVPEALMQAGNFAQMGVSLRLFGLPRSSWQRDRRQLQRVGMRGPLNWYRGAPRGLRPRPVRVPTLYIWGRRDPFLGRKAAELTAKHVTGEYRFEELDAGHWIIDRNAADLQRLLGPHLDAHRAPEQPEPTTTPAPASATTSPSAKPARSRPRKAAAPASAAPRRAKRAPKPPPSAA
ncbi:MAG: alpha/beta hydrolase [Candidatus Dormibacter sp.]